MPTIPSRPLNDRITWNQIQTDYGIGKRAFGRRINFIKDPFKRNIIFRDISHAYLLAKMGYNKPSLITSGSVIEELLRQYLIYKGIPISQKSFNSYVDLCKKNGVIKTKVNDLANSMRQFRNIVHLENEASKRDTISKPTAKLFFGLIFTITNDL